eukprot:9907573-Ditylum_brightwellii.AAC.1
MLCPGTPRSKSSGFSTVNGGTTAANENIPYHMQFQSDAQNMEDAAILYSWIDGGCMEYSSHLSGKLLGYYVLNIIVQKMSKVKLD